MDSKALMSNAPRVLSKLVRAVTLVATTVIVELDIAVLDPLSTKSRETTPVGKMAKRKSGLQVKDQVYSEGSPRKSFINILIYYLLQKKKLKVPSGI